MVIETTQYKLDIDVDATSKYYVNAVEYECPCGGCNNFMVAVEQMSIDLKQQLSNFGVAHRKLIRVSVLYCQENMITYDCTFRVVGTMTKQLPTEIRNDSTDSPFSFRNDRQFFYPCDDFPEPCIQASFVVSLPWVIDETCDY